MTEASSPRDPQHALLRLMAYQERAQFRGYDPYDALNGLPGRLPGKWAAILAVQLLKRLPLNVRPLLGIREGHNPKAMGLFLRGYSLLAAADPEGGDGTKARALFDWVAANSARGYSGPAWGYNFDWASPLKRLPAFAPSVVVTSFVAKGILAYHALTDDERALRLARGACDFVLNDLPLTRTDQGLCISYTPAMRDCCYNASLLGAELLALVYGQTGEPVLRQTAAEAVRFALAHQQDDGRWNYSIDLNTGQERAQVDFHQGFVLDSLLTYIEATGDEDSLVLQAIERGARFYAERQFHPDGRSYWRLPSEWPVDIHHQAQGIITFTRLSARWPEYGEIADRIAAWTIARMQRPDGAFGYRRGRFLANRIPYIRWGQAWMFLALVRLLTSGQNSP